MDETYPNVTCNWCGESCNQDAGPFAYPCGLIEAEARGSYASTPGTGKSSGALDDLTSYKFSLCEFCLDHLFSNFKVPVQVCDDSDGPEPWVPAAHRVYRDEWRKRKEEFFAEKESRDKARGRT